MSAPRFAFDALLRPWRLHAESTPSPLVAFVVWSLLAGLSLALIYTLPTAAPLLAVLAHARGLAPTPAMGVLALGLGLVFDLVVRWLALALLGVVRHKPSSARAALLPAFGIGVGILPGIAALLAAAASGLASQDRVESLHRLTLAFVFFVIVAMVHYGAQVRAWLGASRRAGWILGYAIWGLAVAATWAVPSAGGPVRAFVIDGTSMAPTLLERDRLLVEQGRAPAPGDLVIVRTPSGGDVARRVVGVAGDTISFDGAGTLRDGAPTAEGAPTPAEDVCPECVTRTEHIGAHSYRVAGSVLRIYDTPEPVVVPEGQVYVVGDYRDHRSDDLHRGPVPLSRVVGVAFLRYGSPERSAPLGDL